MEFLKKNCKLVTLSVLGLIGFVFATVLFFDIAGDASFMAMTPVLGFMLFFGGMVEACVSKMLGKDKYSAFTRIGVGALVTLMFLLSIIHIIDTIPSTFFRFTMIIEPIMLMIALGLVPLTIGITKMVCKKDK